MRTCNGWTLIGRVDPRVDPNWVWVYPNLNLNPESLNLRVDPVDPNNHLRAQEKSDLYIDVRAFANSRGRMHLGSTGSTLQVQIGKLGSTWVDPNAVGGPE